MKKFHVSFVMEVSPHFTRDDVMRTIEFYLNAFTKSNIDVVAEGDNDDLMFGYGDNDKGGAQ